MHSTIAESDTAISTYRARRALLIPLFLTIVFLYWIALYLYVPTLPLYIQSKTPDVALVGTALSMYGLWQLISRLPLGICVDWTGRLKVFILIWMLLVAAGDWVLGSSADIGTATLGRALIGIAAGGWVPMVVMFSWLFGSEEVVRSTAILSLFGTLGRIVATSANGWLNQLGGYSLAFRVASGSALLGAALVLFLPDIPRAPQKPSLTRLGVLFRRRDVLLPSLLQALIHIGDFAATFTFIPILARQKGASDVAVSLMLSLDLGMGLLGNLISASVAERIGHRRMSAVCFSLIALGVGGLALAPSLAWVYFFQLFIGLGFGMGYPLLMGMSIRHVDENERTTAMGLHQSIYSLGMFAGPWVSGILASALGLSPMFMIVAAAIFILGIAGSRLIHASAA